MAHVAAELPAREVRLSKLLVAYFKKHGNNVPIPSDDAGRVVKE